MGKSERKGRVSDDFTVFSLSNWKNGITEMGEDCERSSFQKRGQEFILDNLRCLSDIYLERYMRLNFRGEVRTRNVHLEGVSMFMEFKAPGLDKIKREV